MANVISGAAYVAVATNYGNAREQVVASVGYLFTAVYEIVLLQDLLPEVDLLQEFYNSYLVNNDLLKSPVNFLPAVRAINNHVLSRAGDLLTAPGAHPTYGPIDSFLYNSHHGPFTVPQSWADLSAAAGFTITGQVA